MPNTAPVVVAAVFAIAGTLLTSCIGFQVLPVQRPAESLRQSGILTRNFHGAPPACRPIGRSTLLPKQPAKGEHRVILSWTASAPADLQHSGAVGYCVYRGIKPDDPSPVLVNAVAFQGTSCTDDLVQNGNKYYYVVQAISAVGVPSKSSNVALAPIPNRKPSHPGGGSTPPLCREPASIK